MRVVDRRLGVPICRLLTLFRRVGRDRGADATPRRIAVVKLAEQGATVAAYPALRRATELVGRDDVFVAVFAENRAILDELDLVDPANVLTIRTGSLAVLALDVLRLLRRLRKERVDTVVDFEWFSRVSAVLAYLSGASRRVGLHAHFGEGPYRGDLMTHRVPYNPTLPARDVFDHLVAVAAGPPDLLPAIDRPGRGTPVALPRIGATAAERERLASLVAPDGSLPRTLVLLNANAGDLLPLRRWPAERYVELAHRLLDRFDGVGIVLTGAPSEAAAIEPIAEAIGHERCANLAGRTTLRELLVLMTMADVLVTNDSGPAHFAALTGIRAVTLFGPESPAVFGPDSPTATNVWVGLACSPCVNAYNDRQSACHDNICMQHITVDRVEAIVSAHLEAGARA